MAYIVLRMYTYCRSRLMYAKCVQDVYKMYPTIRQIFAYALYTKFSCYSSFYFVYKMYTKVCRDVGREYSRNLQQHSRLARKGTFYEKSAIFYEKNTFFEIRAPKISPTPYSITFLSVLHQNKALYNSCKGGQHLIVERNIGLDYALMGYILYASVTYFLYNF